ncbi:MAG: hypothetical protein OXG27_09450 [Chloroflexi bacterium]|nr:hypothetical protein [Chloroflexota bacterium]
MAVFDTARLRDILVRGGIADEAPAGELVDELEDQVSSALSGYSTQDQVILAVAQVLQAMAEMEARQSRHVNQAVGIMLAGVALGVGLILGFG